MNWFIVIAIILLFLFLIFFLPITVVLGFEQDFSVKIKILGIKFFQTKKKEEKEKKEPAQKDSVKNEKKDSGFFDRLIKKYGFAGAVKKVIGFLKDVLVHIKRFLRHIRINNVKLNVAIASNDAATTAIEYGVVCSVVYPFLAFLESIAPVKYKAIDVKSDFEQKKPQFMFEATVVFNLFFLSLAFFGVYSEYNKFLKREQNNE